MPKTKNFTEEKKEDFGEYLWGAKKDKWNKYGLNYEDFEGASKLEKAKYIIKNYIIPKKDYQSMVDNGMDKKLVFYVKKVIDSLPVSPADQLLSYDRNNYNLKLCLFNNGLLQLNKEEYRISPYYLIKEATLDHIPQEKLEDFVDNYNDTVYKNYINSLKAVNKSLNNIDSYELKLHQLLSGLIEEGIYSSSDSEKSYTLWNTKANKPYIPFFQNKTRTAFGLNDYEIEKQIERSKFLYDEEAIKKDKLKVISKEFSIYYFDNIKVKFDEDDFALKLDKFGYYRDFLIYDPNNPTDILGAPVSEFKPNTYIIIHKDEKIKALNLESMEEAKEKVKELAIQIIAEEEKRTSRKANFTPSQIENIERSTKYSWLEKEVDSTEDDYLVTLKFKGGQFGNWVNAQERILNMNLAYQSFRDIGLALGISEEDITGNGELGIAFGSRGSGNALAHYEPSTKIINLTRMRGAGSLAHEWGHFLDNLLNEKDTNSSSSTLLTSLSKDLDTHLIESFKKKTVNLTKEMFEKEVEATIEYDLKIFESHLQGDLFNNYNGYLNLKRKEKHELLEKIKAMTTPLLEKTKYLVETKTYDSTTIRETAKELSKMYFSQFDSSKYDEPITLESMRAHSYYRTPLIIFEQQMTVLLEPLTRVFDPTATRVVETDFYLDAVGFDESFSGYWTSNHEMFARAFSCYIEDKLLDLGIKNPYLTGHSFYAGTSGEERIAINKKFDELINKAKELGYLKEKDYSSFLNLTKNEDQQQVLSNDLSNNDSTGLELMNQPQQIKNFKETLNSLILSSKNLPLSEEEQQVINQIKSLNIQKESENKYNYNQSLSNLFNEKNCIGVMEINESNRVIGVADVDLGLWIDEVIPYMESDTEDYCDVLGKFPVGKDSYITIIKSEISLSDDIIISSLDHELLSRKLNYSFPDIQYSLNNQNEYFGFNNLLIKDGKIFDDDLTNELQRFVRYNYDNGIISEQLCNYLNDKVADCYYTEKDGSNYVSLDIINYAIDNLDQKGIQDVYEKEKETIIKSLHLFNLPQWYHDEYNDKINAINNELGDFESKVVNYIGDYLKTPIEKDILRIALSGDKLFDEFADLTKGTYEIMIEFDDESFDRFNLFNHPLNESDIQIEGLEEINVRLKFYNAHYNGTIKQALEIAKEDFTKNKIINKVFAMQIEENKTLKEIIEDSLKNATLGTLPQVKKQNENVIAALLTSNQINELEFDIANKKLFEYHSEALNNINALRITHKENMKKIYKNILDYPVQYVDIKNVEQIKSTNSLLKTFFSTINSPKSEEEKRNEIKTTLQSFKESYMVDSDEFAFINAYAQEELSRANQKNEPVNNYYLFVESSHNNESKFESLELTEFQKILKEQVEKNINQLGKYSGFTKENIDKIMMGNLDHSDITIVLDNYHFISTPLEIEKEDLILFAKDGSKYCIIELSRGNSGKIFFEVFPSLQGNWFDIQGYNEDGDLVDEGGIKDCAGIEYYYNFKNDSKIIKKLIDDILEFIEEDPKNILNIYPDCEVEEAITLSQNHFKDKQTSEVKTQEISSSEELIYSDLDEESELSNKEKYIQISKNSYRIAKLIDDALFPDIEKTNHSLKSLAYDVEMGKVEKYIKLLNQQIAINSEAKYLNLRTELQSLPKLELGNSDFKYDWKKLTTNQVKMILANALDKIDLNNPDNIKNLSKFVSGYKNINNFSLSNQLLIFVQEYERLGENLFNSKNPMIYKSFDEWKELGGSAKKGQHALISIIANNKKEIEYVEEGKGGSKVLPKTISKEEYQEREKLVEEGKLKKRETVVIEYVKMPKYFRLDQTTLALNNKAEIVVDYKKNIAEDEKDFLLEKLNLLVTDLNIDSNNVLSFKYLDKITTPEAKALSEQNFDSYIHNKDINIAMNIYNINNYILHGFMADLPKEEQLTLEEIEMQNDLSSRIVLEKLGIDSKNLDKLYNLSGYDKLSNLDHNTPEYNGMPKDMLIANLEIAEELNKRIFGVLEQGKDKELLTQYIPQQLKKDQNGNYYLKPNGFKNILDPLANKKNKDIKKIIEKEIR